jgi:hypothetical protein
VRRIAAQQFQVFAINCAHLGCPVRWFAQSKLFLCPCHGGAYYEDGTRASGPPERGLFQYRYRIAGDSLEIIHAGEMPTLATQASCKPANPEAPRSSVADRCSGKALNPPIIAPASEVIRGPSWPA